LIEGKDTPRQASAPTGELLQADQRRARTGQASTLATARASGDAETRLALSEYHPFWYVGQIPEKTAVRFVIAEKDLKVNNETNAIAAAKLLKGPTDVVRVAGLTHTPSEQGAAFDKAVSAAIEWFLKHL